jgi:hypothetical protein
MDIQESPVVTPQKVLEKRGIKEPFSTDMAIVCFRGKTASDRLIERLKGKPIQRKVLYHPKLFHSSEHNLLIVPEMIWGGPVTAIIIEELYTLGIRKLIGFGAAGSINPEVRPGAMFVAEKTICIDGTSKEYTNQKDCGPDPQLLNYYVGRSKESDMLFLKGLTTDSLYRETPKKIQNWRRLGADFINLEISPFYLVSRFLAISAVYVGLITDFVGEKWISKYWSIPNEVDPRIIENIKDLCTEVESE